MPLYYILRRDKSTFNKI